MIFSRIKDFWTVHLSSLCFTPWGRSCPCDVPPSWNPFPHIIKLSALFKVNFDTCGATISLQPLKAIASSPGKAGNIFLPNNHICYSNSVAAENQYEIKWISLFHHPTQSLKANTEMQPSSAISHLKNLDLLCCQQTMWGYEWVMFLCTLTAIFLSALEQVT